MIEAVAGRSSAAKAKGSALSGWTVAVGADDLELVGAAGADVGDEDLPHADVARGGASGGGGRPSR